MIQIFASNNLDSAAAIVALKLIYPNTQFNITQGTKGTYGSLEKAIKNFNNETSNNDITGAIILNYAPSNETIYNLSRKFEKQFNHAKKVIIINQYLTEHDRLMQLNKSINLIASQHQNGQKTSTTSLIADYTNKYHTQLTQALPELIDSNIQALLRNHRFLSFIQAIRAYDTWEFKTNNKLPLDIKILANDMNTLHEIEDNDIFIEQMVSNLKQNQFVNSLEKQLIENYIERQEDYATYVLKNVTELVLTIDNRDYRVKACMADRYISEIGNRLANLPDTDVGIVLNNNRLSFRVREENDNVDASVIAQHFNGNGYAKTSGGKSKIDVAEVIARAYEPYI